MLGETHNRSIAAGAAPVTAVRVRGGDDWAMPDSGAGEPDDAGGTAGTGPTDPTDRSVMRAGDRGTGWAGEGGWTDEAPPREPPPLPVRLGEMSVTDLLDGAWAVLTCRLRTVLGLSAAIIIPAALAVSLLVRRSGADDPGASLVRALPYGNFWPGAGGNEEDMVRAVAAVAILSLAYFVLGAAIGKLVAAWYTDVDLRGGQVLAPTARRSPALLVGWLVTSFCELVVLVMCPIGFLLLPAFLLVAPLITVERRGPFSALRRSFSLVGRRYGATLVLLVAAVIVERLVLFALLFFIELVAALAPGTVAEALRAGSWAFGAFVTAPVVVAVPALLYIDLRVRAEGFDLESEAEDLFPEVAGDH